MDAHAACRAPLLFSSCQETLVHAVWRIMTGEMHNRCGKRVGSLAPGSLDSKSRHCRNSDIVLRPTQIAIKVLTKPHHRSLAAPSFSLSAPVAASASARRGKPLCAPRSPSHCGFRVSLRGLLGLPFQNLPQPSSPGRVATPQQRSIGPCFPQTSPLGKPAWPGKTEETITTGS